jgi:hypothetical protein
MTTTKDHIRKTAWFTSNGLPDPRLEGPEKRLALNLNEYWDRFWKMIESVFTGIPGIP